MFDIANISLDQIKFVWFQTLLRFIGIEQTRSATVTVKQLIQLSLKLGAFKLTKTQLSSTASSQNTNSFIHT